MNLGSGDVIKPAYSKSISSSDSPTLAASPVSFSKVCSVVGCD